MGCYYFAVISNFETTPWRKFVAQIIKMIINKVNLKAILPPFVILFCLLIFYSCSKKPVAGFNTDKTEYIAGEKVLLTNTSVNAVSYLWTLPNGLTAEAVEPTFTIPESASSGELTFKLEAFGEDKKSSSTSQSIKVKAATGTITAWTPNNTVGTITVKANDMILGSVGAYYQFNPGCGASGCVTAELNVGNYTITSIYASSSSSGTVTIKKKQCVTFLLQ